MFFSLRLDEKKILLQNECSLSDVPIIIFSALCQQGSAVTPTSITGKMVMILSFISFMFLFVSYCANIVALLQSPSNQIRTLQDLYDTKMGFSVLDTVYNRHYFAVSVQISTNQCKPSSLHYHIQTESEPFRKRFYEEKVFVKDGKSKFVTLEDGIKKVREVKRNPEKYASSTKNVSHLFRVSTHFTQNILKLIR